MTKPVYAYALAFLALSGVGAIVACSVTATVGNDNDTCAQDGTVLCTDGTGYSCTGSDTPDQDDSTLVCSYPQDGNAGSTTFCCFSHSSTSTTCGVDTSVTGCAPGSFGFSCTDATEPPQNAYPQLTCSSGQSESSGGEAYCCTDGTTSDEDSGTVQDTGVAPTGACVTDTSVVCDAGSGYSCTGTAFPQTSNPALACTQTFVDDAGGVAEYCCTGG